MKDYNFEISIGVLKGLKIGLFLNDKQFVEGTLLDVKQDHLVVDVNHNVFYFALKQIHAISNNAKGFSVSPKIIVPHLNKNLLTDVLKALKYNWITINSLSNQVFVGLLSRISEDHILLINNEEQLHIPKSYISNIYKGIYEINELQEEISQEKDVQESLSPTNKDSKERAAFQAEIQSQQEEQVADKQIQITNNNELEKNGEDPFMEIHDKEESEVENLNKDYPQVKPKTEFKGETNFPELDAHNLLNNDIEYSPEVDCQEVLESNKNSVISEDQLILPKPQFCHKKKTKLPIPLNSFSNVQHVTWEIIYDDVRGVSTYDGNSNKMDHNSEKYAEAPLMEKYDKKEREVENLNKEYPKVKPKIEFKGEPNFPQSVTQDLLDEPEVSRKKVLESSKNSVISVDQLIPTVPHFSYKKKRKIPITIYGFSKANQAITRKIIFVKVREVTTHE